MTELTFEEFCEQPMQYCMGMSADTYARRLWRNNALGIQKETFTKRNPRTMRWGLGSTSYFLDNDPREFGDIADLYVAWMHRVCNVPEAA